MSYEQIFIWFYIFSIVINKVNILLNNINLNSIFFFKPHHVAISINIIRAAITYIIKSKRHGTNTAECCNHILNLVSYRLLHISVLKMKPEEGFMKRAFASDDT